MSNPIFQSYYREIYSDLCVTQEENEELQQKFQELNPPPDKLTPLRALLFRTGVEYLFDDDKEENVKLLKCINALVHALEVTCMCPNVPEDNEEFDPSSLEEIYHELFSDLTIDGEEHERLTSFLQETPPSISQLIATRSSAFRIASEYLSEGDSDANIQLLRCINVIVHVIEQTCMVPKPYQLTVEPDPETSIEAIGTEASISTAAQALWDLDVNRLLPGQDYEINVQEGKKPYIKDDLAEEPLFSMVEERVFTRPTYQTFRALLDNYVSETGVEEEVTEIEEEEQDSFLRAVYQTGPMQYCHKYCCANNEDIPSDPEEFHELLKEVWFGLYNRSRGGRLDSSGFEHVFVGEIKNDKVSGFHNWIYFYLEEQKGTVNYKGYIKPRRNSDEVDAAETNDDDHVLTLQFEWNGVEKFVGTSFIGVSPEFEMALYTMCFFVGEEENILEINMGADIFQLNCKVYTYDEGKIGTSFVEALQHYD